VVDSNMYFLGQNSGSLALLTKFRGRVRWTVKGEGREVEIGIIAASLASHDRYGMCIESGWLTLFCC
jgi:hypothetical protein